MKSVHHRWQLRTFRGTRGRGAQVTLLTWNKLEVSSCPSLSHNLFHWRVYGGRVYWSTWVGLSWDTHSRLLQLSA